MDPEQLTQIAGGLALGALIGFLAAKALTAPQARALAARLEEARTAGETLRRERDDGTAQIQTFREKAAGLEAEKAALARRIEEHKADLEKMNETFQARFENLATRIFDEKTRKFGKESQENLDRLLSPLKERLNDFQKKVDDSFGGQAKEQFALKEEIRRIVAVNEKMTLQAESLAKALKGDSKTQGNWGEILLEKILEDSGLRKGVDYRPQGADLGLKTADGRHQKPDIVVMLPDSKHIIIDSKVSLTHYERFCAEPGESERADHLRGFLTSVRAHIAGLEQRRYQDTEKLGTPDFVLMFMPIEGAYALAVQQDAELQSYAWDRRIVIVCPSTLFATLKTVASVWRLEMQNRNALEIARSGGDLYDKIAGFVDDMQKLGDNLKTAEKTYSGAMNKLSEGRGNILRRTQHLKELGAKASKSLPPDLLADDGEEGEEPSPERLKA